MLDQNIELDGRTFSVRVHGKGPCVLLVHGYPLSNRMWQSTIKEIGAHHCCIAPDLRGFGASSAETEPFSMADLADDLERLIDYLEVPDVSLVGLSMGGYIAFEFWARHADRLRSLVLCDTRAAKDSPEQAQARLVAAEKVEEIGVQSTVEPMIPRLLGERARKESPALVEELKKMMFATRSSTIAFALRAMAARRDFTSELGRIALPSLVIVGEHDVISTKEEMESISNGIRNSEFHIIADSGHMPPMEQPDTFCAVLREFLERVG